MISKYTTQLITPTGNDYFRLKEKSSYYVKINHSVSPLAELLTKGKFHLVEDPSSFGLYLGLKGDPFTKLVEKIAERTKTYQSEKGLDTLYLTFGSLKWQIGDSSGIAPLLCLPATLAKVGNYWEVNTQGIEELLLNPMLAYLVKTAPLDIKDTEVPIAVVNATLQSLKQDIEQQKPGWQVDVNIQYFGSFIYPGIALAEVEASAYSDPSLFQELIESPITAGQELILTNLPSEAVMDSMEFENNLPHTLLPADSSQLKALMDVVAGANVVLQGPPGTGKSQTIVNLIFDAIRRGKTVLFVAQKETSLTVVYNRLKQKGHNHLCLKLYADKSGSSDRIQLYEYLRGHSQEEALNVFEAPLDAYQKEKLVLGAYGETLSNIPPGLPMSPYELMGEIVSYRPRVTNVTPLNIPIATSLDSNQYGQLIELLVAYGHILKDLPRLDLWEWYQPSKVSSNQIHTQLENGLKELEELKPFWETYPTLSEIQSTRSHICDQINQTLAYDSVVSRLRLTYQLNVTPFNIESYITEITSLLKLAWYKRFFNSNWKLWKVKLGTDPLTKLTDISNALQQAKGTIDKGILTTEEVKEQSQIMASLQHLETNILSFHRLGLRHTIINDLHKHVTYLLSNWATTVTMGKLEQNLTAQRAIITELPEKAEGQIHTQQYPHALLKKLHNAWSEQLEALFTITPNASYQSFRKLSKEVEAGQALSPYKISTTDLSQSNTPLVANKREFALIKHVIETPKARIPIRNFIERAQESLLKLTPCWMTTPSKLSQYVPRQSGMFDLVIIDEASQLLKAEGIGALARAKQYVIVGDSEQMPPSILMRETLDQEDEEEPQESILQWASVNTPRQRTLLYHYRSEHHSLIEFSNHHFYQDKLFCVPGQKLTDDLGIKVISLNEFDKPPTAIYSKGGTNLTEAKRLITEVQEYIFKFPGRSIGIVSMNKAQQDVLSSLFEAARAKDTNLQTFCRRKENEGYPVFIKNLETVQGDERDVIFISTVYGPNDAGVVAQSFGINSDTRGDYKRINVLITRAKKQVIVITSLRPHDITTTAKAPQILQAYIDYGRSGSLSGMSPQTAKSVSDEVDSPWEAWFYEKLQQRGYKVDTQIGAGPWRIDLGIKGNSTESYPYYVCGIELDGAAYHSSVWARERDALRQEVLESHGWTILRVWSRDFFRNTEGELQNLIQEINKVLEKQKQTLPVLASTKS